MKDQRAHTRIRTQGTVMLKPAIDSPTVTRAALVDVSYKGMAVSCREMIEKGRIVFITLANVAPLKGWLFIGTGEVVAVNATKRGASDVYRISFKFVDVQAGVVQRVIQGILRHRILQTRKKAVTAAAGKGGSVRF
ncbi:MAG TPA: PilZ domain-containing protein [Dissulfurispiraceae bacterium]|nr:PilZ domain-containing protein [Dissulfurispiraceae bacterium]